MEIKRISDFETIEQHNKLFEEGYKYIVGTQYPTGDFDPFYIDSDGYPCPVFNIAGPSYYAKTKEDINYIYEHFHGVHYYLNRHLTTFEEEEKRKQETKNRKEEKEKRKADNLNLTIKEYRQYKYKKGKIKTLKNTIEELEKQIKKEKKFLQTLEKEIAKIENNT